MEESRLAERCARGERQACRELYDCYAGRLLAIGTRYTGSREAAEDVLQEAFIKVFSSIKSFRYRGEGSLYAWLRRILFMQSIFSFSQHFLQVRVANTKYICYNFLTDHLKGEPIYERFLTR